SPYTGFVHPGSAEWRSPLTGPAGGVELSDRVECLRDSPPDGFFVQGRDADRASPVAVVVGRARVEFATVAELGAFPGHTEVVAMSLRHFQALPTRIADGTLVQGVVDMMGRVDITGVSVLAGGARVDLADDLELAICGYAGLPVRVIPSRVYRALQTVPAD